MSSSWALLGGGRGGWQPEAKTVHELMMQCVAHMLPIEHLFCFVGFAA